MPASPARLDGKEVKKSGDSRPPPSMSMSTNKAVNVKTPIISAIRPTKPKMASHRLCDAISLRICSTRVASLIGNALIGLAEAFSHDVSEHVKEQRDDREREPCCK